MALHRDLTGSDLHEPKGISTANAGTSYISNGSGSGNWTLIGPANINQAEVLNLNKYSLVYEFKDISTPNTVFIPVTRNSQLVGITGVLNGVITGNNSKIEFKNGGLLSMGLFDISYTTSGAGVMTNMVPSTNTTVYAPSFISLTCDGLSTGTVDCVLILDFVLIPS